MRQANKRYDMIYAILKRKNISLGEYALVGVREQDMENIRQWRNAQMDVLRQNKVLTQEDQRRYYAEVVVPSFTQPEPRITLVSFLKNGECIGYGGLTNIDWQTKRAEISFLLDPVRVGDENSYKKEFGIFLELIKEVAFKDMGLTELFTETYDIRPFHISELESHGFILKGRLRRRAVVNEKLVDSVLHRMLVSEYGE